MTDLPPVEYLDEAARHSSWQDWAHLAGTGYNASVVIAHARALHQLALARAEIAALKPRETLREVAWREACVHYHAADRRGAFCTGFLRCHEMMKEGTLPDE